MLAQRWCKPLLKHLYFRHISLFISISQMYENKLDTDVCRRDLLKNKTATVTI